MMIAIDIGNTRIKWGLHDGRAWVAGDALPTPEAARLREAAAAWPAAARIVACNVAGAAVEAAVDGALAPRRVHWLRSGREACGVRSTYAQPETLGADRWAALIGARARGLGNCLVVCAGTATTINVLDADGVFRGGAILPGVDMMRSSLAGNTAQLAFADGAFCAEPRSTADAIVSGCLHAQLGAIERMFAPLAAFPDARCLLTGGAAAQLAPHLRVPSERVDTLVLDGLLRFGAGLPPQE